MNPQDLAQRIETVRRFNRFYTRQIGLLSDHYLNSPFSLTEARVIFELAQYDETHATELRKQLNLDAGYLIRILRHFEKQGLITRRPSQQDGRQSRLNLTDQGREIYEFLNRSSREGIESMLNKVSGAEQARVVQSMNCIQALLDEDMPKPQVPYILRPPQAGDMGWVVQQHGKLYAEEYGWNEQFEALVAEIVAAFVRNYDPKYERCWIAEREVEPIGSVFVVKKAEGVAKLRMLLVDPRARGLGIGGRLVEECIRFARQIGYQKMELWTNSILTAARHIYKKAGFVLVESEPYHDFGKDLVSETWELTL